MVLQVAQRAGRAASRVRIRFSIVDMVHSVSERLLALEFKRAFKLFKALFKIAGFYCFSRKLPICAIMAAVFGSTVWSLMP